MSLAATPWMIWIIVIPLTAAIIAFLARRQATMIGLISAGAISLCAGMVVWQVVELGPLRHQIGGWGAPLGIDLYVDGLSSLMLAMTAVVGLFVSIYAAGYFRSLPQQREFFWPLWLFLWAALNALFLAADAFTLYVTLELLALSAVPLAALAGTATALGAAMRYLFVSMLGSLTYLLGIALLYANYGTLDLNLLGEAVRPGAIAWIAMAVITVGLLLKTAVFPLHFWLPPAHSNAPAPVSAVLSALVVKASFYLLLRFWFEVFDGVVTPGVAQIIGLLGGLAIIWGSLLALRQSRLKLVVAYSTVAQLGYLFLAFPLVLSVGNYAWRGVVYFAISHAVAKAAMFMSTGALMQAAGHDRLEDMRFIAPRMPSSMIAFALAGISLIGLPPTGGFLAKWSLLDAALQSGQWWWALVILLGGILAAAYVFRVVASLFYSRTDVTPVKSARALETTALLLALVAIVLGFVALYPFQLMAVGGPQFDNVLFGVTP